VTLLPSHTIACDYSTSRKHFREAAATLRLTLEVHSINQSGPDGEDLTIDVAIAPGIHTKSALVISSGLHGVEGLLGSAGNLS